MRTLASGATFDSSWVAAIPSRLLDGLATGGCQADDLDARIRGEQLGEAGSHQVLIVGDHDAGHPWRAPSRDVRSDAKPALHVLGPSVPPSSVARSRMPTKSVAFRRRWLATGGDGIATVSWTDVSSNTSSIRALPSSCRVSASCRIRYAA